MKVTSEKLPKSLLALNIELDRDRVEKGLDRAARRFSQKHNIPGFRKGKAPRFIIENYFGREALIEEATEDLINKAFKDALIEQQIDPIGPASLGGIQSTDPFAFRVMVPVAPTVTLGDYRTIRVDHTVEPVSDEVIQRAMDALRDKHVVLQELEEPRPAQQGDRLTVKLESIVDGEPLEERKEGQETPDTSLDLEPGRLVDELYNGLLGANIGDELEIPAHMPDDHANEQVRDKQVTFKVSISAMQQRLLPEWDDLPALESADGTIDDLREKTHKELEESARSVAERTTIDNFISQLVESTSYDLPDVMVESLADDMLHDQGKQFERYGITLDQMLQYRGKTHDQAVEELKPDAERQTRITLALQQLSRREDLLVHEEEIEVEIQRLLNDYTEEQRPNALQTLSTQMRGSVANMVLDRKLRERLVAIATGAAPELPALVDETVPSVVTANDTPEPIDDAVVLAADDKA